MLLISMDIVAPEKRAIDNQLATHKVVETLAITIQRHHSQSAPVRPIEVDKTSECWPEQQCVAEC
jgi:hypothetical protein